MTDDSKENENHPDIDAAINRAKSAAESIAQLEQEVRTTLISIQNTQNEAKTSADNTRTVLNETAALLEQVKTARSEVLATLEKTKTDSAQTAEIARTANEKDQRVDEYEKQLDVLNDKYTEINERLLKLLPAATGVGLAKSFHSRKEALQPALTRYITLFLISIIGFIAFGFWALLAGEIRDINGFIVFALERSPIIVGLILLEEFSRRQFHATTKLEEDYAYKETISIAFDGYQKAMSSVDAAAQETLATNLGRNVLDTLNQRPGRLIDIENPQSSISIDKLIDALSSSSDAHKQGNIIEHVFTQLRKSFMTSLFRNASIIILVLIIGLVIGYRLSTNPSVELSVNTSGAATNLTAPTKNK